MRLISAALCKCSGVSYIETTTHYYAFKGNILQVPIGFVTTLLNKKAYLSLYELMWQLHSLELSLQEVSLFLRPIVYDGWGPDLFCCCNRVLG